MILDDFWGMRLVLLHTVHWSVVLLHQTLDFVARANSCIDILLIILGPWWVPVVACWNPHTVGLGGSRSSGALMTGQFGSNMINSRTWTNMKAHPPEKPVLYLPDICFRHRSAFHPEGGTASSEISSGQRCLASMMGWALETSSSRLRHVTTVCLGNWWLNISPNSGTLLFWRCVWPFVL